jgi:dCMP deaminase
VSTPSTTRPDWDTYYLNMAGVVATRADCTRRQVGCVIVDEDHRVISTGYNGAPAGLPGCLSDGACPRGQKSYEEVAPFSTYAEGAGACIAAHAEANALLYARTSCKGATAYITCPPCHGCSILLQAAGINTVIFPEEV